MVDRRRTSRTPLDPRARVAEMAARILSVPRFERGASHKGWVSNGIFYRRDKDEAMFRLARVIDLKRKMESVELMLSHDDLGGKKGLRIWWRAKSSPGRRYSKLAAMTPDERAEHLEKKRIQNAENARERVRRFKAAGLCTVCGKNPQPEDILLCPPCVANRKLYEYRRMQRRKLS